MAKKPKRPALKEEQVGDTAAAVAGVSEGLANPRGAEAMERLQAAYEAVFSGGATRSQCQIVLTDLACYSGFFQVCAKGTNGEVLQFQEGMRSVYGRIHNFLNFSGPELERLHQAARQEAIINTSEGYL